MTRTPLSRILVVIVALALIGVAAIAAAGRNHGIVTSADGRYIIATQPSNHITPAQAEPNLSLIAGNLSRYPNAVFFCCYGLTISGPTSFLGEAYWDAIPFTPTANTTVRQIEVSVGWGFNGANGVTASLNADSNGLPGTALATANLTNLAGYGDCCQLAIARGAAVPVTAGTQYWVVVSTSNTTTATYDGWAFNSTDMRAYQFATYSSKAGVWSLVTSLEPGYAVLGN